MPEEKAWYTVPELADTFCAGRYHEVYHLIRKGALTAVRPKAYRVLVPATSAELIFGPTAAEVVKKP